MRTRRILAAVAVTLGTALSALPISAASADREPLALSGLRTVDAQRVAVVADVDPVPLTPLKARDVTVTAGGATIPVSVQAVLPDRVSMSVIVDASAQASESTAGGGLSGVASFMLGAPVDATLSVVADQDPPVLAAPPVQGVSAALDAASKLQPAGGRSTAAAIALALQQAHPGLVVLYTAAADAGGEAAAALGARVQAAGAVLAVVTTSPDDGYWAAAAQRTGGLALTTTPASAIQTFDQLSDALRGRSILTFAPPAGATSVTVTADLRRGPATATLELPSAASPGRAGPGRSASTGSDSSSGATGIAGSVWIVVLIGVLVAGVVFAAWMRRSRPETARPATVLDTMAGSPQAQALASQVLARRGSPAEGPVVRPPPLPDSWKFKLDDIGAGAATPGSLFEPRKARDARESLEQHENGHEPPLSEPLSQRFEEIRRSLVEPSEPPASSEPRASSSEPRASSEPTASSPDQPQKEDAAGDQAGASG